MSEWRTSSLGLLVHFQKGRKVETSKYLQPGYAPYLGASAISGVVEEFADTNGGVLAFAGDVLMLWDGERSGLVGKAQKGVISSTVSKLSSKGEILGEYLYYVLDSKFEWIQNRRTGTGVPHVPKDIGRILQIAFPVNANVQSRIAEILSTLDDAIKQTEALIAKHRRIKAGLMHDLFTRGVTPDGKLRPPRDEAPGLYKPTALGWVPKEWEVVQFSDAYSTAILGVAARGVSNSETNIPLIKMGNLKSGSLELSGIELLARSSVQDERQILRVGDFLFNTRNTPELVGKVAVYQGEFPVCTCDNNLLCVRFKPGYDPRFFCHYMSHGVGQQRVFAMATGTTSVAAIYWSALARFLVPLPSDLEEQRAVSDRVTHVENCIQSALAELAKLRQQKQGLMHDLLTGKVQVRV